jgi:non-heme chloroperoxidase
MVDGEHILTRDDGTQLRCRSEGTGKAVILTHGILDSHVAFEEVAPLLLKAGRRVIMFDQRAHGDSVAGTEPISPRNMAGDYAAVLSHYDVTDGVLVGHSLGAFQSVVFSILHRDVAKARLLGLVLVSGHAGEAAKGNFQNRIHAAMLEHGIAGLAMRSDFASRFFLRPLFGKRVERRVVDGMIERLRRVNIANILPILRAAMVESYYDRLGEIPVPAIVLRGDLDRTCPRFHSERLAAEIPGSRAVWLPDVGHMVNFEAPSAIVDAVEEHLTGSGSARANGAVSLTT